MNSGQTIDSYDRDKFWEFYRDRFGRNYYRFKRTGEIVRENRMYLFDERIKGILKEEFIEAL